MRLSTSALIVGLAIFGLPLSALADCTAFSPDGPACAASKPKLQVDFAKLVADKVQAEKMLERLRQAMRYCSAIVTSSARPTREGG